MLRFIRYPFSCSHVIHIQDRGWFSTISPRNRSGYYNHRAPPLGACTLPAGGHGLGSFGWRFAVFLAGHFLPLVWYAELAEAQTAELVITGSSSASMLKIPIISSTKDATGPLSLLVRLLNPYTTQYIAGYTVICWLYSISTNVGVI